jgi:HD-GYP domain-containing protein (c-di-GMP phosphodiesterase class II)
MLLTAVVAPEHAGDPQFTYGFLLHDIGKLTMPASMFMNLDDYSDAEWELMKQHPELGRSALEDLPFLADAGEIVHAHHERWDGKGYPRGMTGDEIPIGARILQLCDAFNAMTKDRVHHKASSIVEARGELHTGRGTQFWPVAVDGFLSLSDDELEAVGGVYCV